MLYWKRREDKLPLKQGSGSGSGLGGDDGDIIVDQTYSSNSYNAQSGTAVSQAVDQSFKKVQDEIGGVMHYKGEVETEKDLPENSEHGDIYNVKETNANFVWDGKNWDKLNPELSGLASKSSFDSLKSSFESHIKNEDSTAHHITQEEYDKFTKGDHLTKSKLSELVDSAIETFVSERKITKQTYWDNNVDKWQQQIEESVLRLVNEQLAKDILLKTVFESYQKEVEEKTKKFVKCDLARKLDIYLPDETAPSLSSRTSDHLYMVTTEGEEPEPPEPEPPDPPEPPEPEPTGEGQMYITVQWNPEIYEQYKEQGIVVDYSLDLGPLLGSKSKQSNVTGGTLDWGDGTEVVTFGNGDGTTDEKFKHKYNDNTEHIITITGAIKWGDWTEPANVWVQGTHTQVSAPNPKDIRRAAIKVVIPEGKTSPIYDKSPYAFTGMKFGEGGIPANLLENCTIAEDFNHDFATAGFTTIPDNLLSKCKGAKYFEHCFAFGSYSEIPDSLFSGCPEAEDFYCCFLDCNNFKTIPDNLFAKNTKARTFRACFQDCYGLEKIPSNLFKNCTEAEDFTDCFYSCAVLHDDPLPELWNTHSEAKHYGCFCQISSALLAIGQSWGYPSNQGEAVSHGWGCFDNFNASMKLKVTITDTTKKISLPVLYEKAMPDIEITWGDGTEKESFTPTEKDFIPDHEYSSAGDYIIEVENSDGYIHWGYDSTKTSEYANFKTALTAIDIPYKCPIDQFNESAFAGYTNLESISPNLLTNIEKGDSGSKLENMFNGCTKLTKIPERLFFYVPQITDKLNLVSTFANTGITEIPAKLFKNLTFEIPTFKGCFENCTSIKNSVPELWTEFSESVGTDCFKGCNNVANYSQIPEDWK